MKRFVKLFYISLLLIFSNINSSVAYSPLPFKMVVGEIKGLKGIYAGYQQLISQSDPNFSYTIILEKSASYCYFINRYILNVDTNCLKYIPNINAEEKNLYINIRNKNLNRLVQNKIKIKSFDIEYQSNFAVPLNAFYYMISMVSSKVIQMQVDSIYLDSLRPNFVKAKDLIRFIDSTRISELNPDDSIYQIIKKNLINTVALGQPFTKSWFKKREYLIEKEFINAIYGLDRFCAIVNNNHMPNKRTGNAFLKKIDLKGLGILCYYPIYINRFSNKELEKSFYCGHRKNPFIWNKNLLKEFTKKSGAWLLSSRKTNYLVISN